MKRILPQNLMFHPKDFTYILIIVTTAWVALYKYRESACHTPDAHTFFDEESGQRLIKTDWKSYDDISNYMKMAVIASEDQTFPFHDGFDLQCNRRGNRRGWRVSA